MTDPIIVGTGSGALFVIGVALLSAESGLFLTVIGVLCGVFAGVFIALVLDDYVTSGDPQ